MSHAAPGIEPESAEITPNVVIANPVTRKNIGVVLYIISVLAGVAALFFLFFPELGGDVANRAILFINALISLLSGSFGIVVTRPNIPTPAVDAAKLKELN